MCLQEEADNQRALADRQRLEVEQLSQEADTLKEQIRSQGVAQTKESDSLLRKLKSQNAELQAQLEEQQEATKQQIVDQRKTEQQAALERDADQQRRSEDGGKAASDVSEPESLRQHASELEKENSLLRKQLSQLDGSYFDTR